jgi:nucleotide-binding universal stress UspA family protein
MLQWHRRAVITLRTILCPIDFSDASREALRWAVAVAARQHSRLIVLAALEPLLAHAAQARFKQDLKADTATTLEDFVAGVVERKESERPKYDLDVQIGSASDVIVDAATRNSVDLVVMGTYGISGFRKLLLGSTTERVLRRTQVPILAVPHADHQPSAHMGANRPVLPLATVLVATDFSEPAERAVRWASDLAHEHAATLVIAHIVAPLAVRVEWTGYVEGINEERMSAARAQLDERVASLGTSIQVESIVMLGRPVEAIASIANARNVSLLVMGLTGTERILAPRPGSTAYGVLSSVQVPVLVVPPEIGA